MVKLKVLYFIILLPLLIFAINQQDIQYFVMI